MSASCSYWSRLPAACFGCAAFQVLLPTSGRGGNYMHFSVCENRSCWPVNIVCVCWRNVPLVGVLNSPMNEPCPVCVYTLPPVTLHVHPDSNWSSFSSSSPEASVWTQRGGHMSSSLCLCRPCGEWIPRVYLGLLLCVWTGRKTHCRRWINIVSDSDIRQFEFVYQTSRHVVKVNLSWVLPIYLYRYFLSSAKR